MKINPPVWATPVHPEDVRRVSAVAAAPSPATRVTLSPEARWVENVRHEAAKPPVIRQDVVDRTRAAIADGSYEKSVDFDAVVNRLLSGE